MKTSAQIKTAVYNAVTTDTAIIANLGAQFYWMLRPSVPPLTEFATFQILDTVGSYVVGGCVNRSYEQVDVQINLYGVISSYTKFDTLTEDIKRVMEAIGFMLIASPEFEDESLKRPVRALRWRYQNV